MQFSIDILLNVYDSMLKWIPIYFSKISYDNAINNSLYFLLQFVFLSLQKIAFGNVPLFSMSRRILFANNYSSERNATLEWHLSNEADEEVSFGEFHQDVFPNAMVV